MLGSFGKKQLVMLSLMALLASALVVYIVITSTNNSPNLTGKIISSNSPSTSVEAPIKPLQTLQKQTASPSKIVLENQEPIAKVLLSSSGNLKPIGNSPSPTGSAMLPPELRPLFDGLQDFKLQEQSYEDLSSTAREAQTLINNIEQNIVSSGLSLPFPTRDGQSNIDIQNLNLQARLLTISEPQ